MKRAQCIVLVLAVATAAVSSAQLAWATDHQNLEHGIPTALEDIEPIEHGNVELQEFGTYFRQRGGQNRGETEPRLVWGIYKEMQLAIATPLLLGAGAANGNGDVQLTVLRKLWDDSPNAPWPGVAIAVDVRFPTGVERRGFDNGFNVGFTAALKKDIGPHSFHLNVGFEWSGDSSEEESLRSSVWSVIAGHDMPLTNWLLLVSDVVWRQAEVRGETDVWLLETGLRAQLARGVIVAFGLGVGLNRGPDTPRFAATAGFQLGF